MAKKKTSRSSTTEGSAAGSARTSASRALLDQVRAEGYRQGVVDTRGMVNNFLHGTNDPMAFTLLEKLRAEFVRLDQSGGGISPGSIRFEIVGEGEEWSWQAVASNGELMADSADDTYTRREDAQRGATRFIELVKAAATVSLKEPTP